MYKGKEVLRNNKIYLLRDRDKIVMIKNLLKGKIMQIRGLFKKSYNKDPRRIEGLRQKH